ncbi:MAG: branched-chain amino acid ABC transporter permease [Candidatus Puniceispirillales bacterium]
MSETARKPVLFAAMGLMIIMVGMLQSWNLAFALVNLCLISAIMTLGVNIQWGYAGLVNFGMMGFTALGGISAVIISMPPVHDAIAAGGGGIALAVLVAIITTALAVIAWRRLAKQGRKRIIITAGITLIGAVCFRLVLDPAVAAIEAVEPAKTGYLGGFGLPIMLSWIVGALVAAAVAWMIGKVALGLRSDYLAIATLGISEIIIYMLKNEDWFSRGVKNVSGLPRPVPYEVELQQAEWFIGWSARLGLNVTDASTLMVKGLYAIIFILILAAVYWLSETALKSPWGRMMRAIRDNEVSANAMGKDVTSRHLQVFILGSALVGLAGAMLTTLDGQFTPASYQPLRFTFLIWVMVIVGGSGNNAGAILGGFLIWFFWIEAEPIGLWLINMLTLGMADDSWLKMHLLKNAAHTRLMTMGLVLLLVLRFAPRGLIPEEKR